MRKMFSMLVLALFLALTSSVVFAAVNAQNSGTNLGVVEKVNFSTGLTATKSGSTATVVASGTQAITAGTINGAVIGGVTPAAGTFTALTATSAEVDGILTTDGTIYTAKIMSDGAIYGGRATVNPCATLTAGYVFFNNSTGVPCYCGNDNLDYAIYSASARCF
jgi:ABC-type oligopeptide transport system substrate-binding subunit